MLQCCLGGQKRGGAMRIFLNLIGVVLVSIFLVYMAIYLNELPLYVVCGIGVVLVLVGFWQDEMQGENANGQQGRG
jgi:Na+-transporting methylmalonyl-CoA/oxaloacetate decarboxylase beta subunit